MDVVGSCLQTHFYILFSLTTRSRTLTVASSRRSSQRLATLPWLLVRRKAEERDDGEARGGMLNATRELGLESTAEDGQGARGKVRRHWTDDGYKTAQIQKERTTG